MALHGLLEGKRLLITGVLNHRSIAFHVAAAAQRQGASVLLSSPPQVRGHTEKAVKELPERAAIIDLDVSEPDSVAALPAEVDKHLGGLDGMLHGIAFGDPSTVGGSFVEASADAAASAFAISAHSLAALAGSCADLLSDEGGSVVGLSFETRFAWPGYNWMGVAKAALEATARYTARELGPRGVRINVVSAGPLRTLSARSVPGFSDLADSWDGAAPLSWNPSDPTSVADACCFLLSDLARSVTGEVLHADGGMHAVVAGVDGR